MYLSYDMKSVKKNKETHHGNFFKITKKSSYCVYIYVSVNCFERMELTGLLFRVLFRRSYKVS